MSDGGGITAHSVTGTLPLLSLTLTNNRVTSSLGRGGGIFLYSTTASHQSVELSGNSAAYGGNLGCHSCVLLPTGALHSGGNGAVLLLRSNDGLQQPPSRSRPEDRDIRVEQRAATARLSERARPSGRERCPW